MLLLEKNFESPLDSKIKPVHPKGNQSWISIGKTDAEVETDTLATGPEELTHLKRPWCWERLKAGEGDDRGWDGWMASPSQWTWVWARPGIWWGTEKPGVLQFMRLQRVRHHWVIELNWNLTDNTFLNIVTVIAMDWIVRPQFILRWLDGITDSMDMSLSELRECCDSWDRKESDTTEWLNWTELNSFWFLTSRVIVFGVRK